MNWVKSRLKDRDVKKRQKACVCSIVFCDLVGLPVLVNMNKSFAAVCGGKYRHNSVENDYCGGKPGFVVSPGLVTSLGLWLRVRVSVSISGGGGKPSLPPQ